MTEHGWVQTPRTGIVDPTLVLEEMPTRLEYLPGLQLSWSEIQARTEQPLPLARLRPGGLAYQEACRVALERGEQWAWQTGLPLICEPGWVKTLTMGASGLLVFEEMTWDFPVPSTPSARVSSLLHEMEEGAEWR